MLRKIVFLFVILGFLVPNLTFSKNLEKIRESTIIYKVKADATPQQLKKFNALINKSNTITKREIKGVGINVVKLSNIKGQEKLFSKHLVETGAVKFALPDASVPHDLIPDDSYYDSQWHHAVIGSPAAWDITQGTDSVKVCVLDTGVDTDHPDLVDNLLPGYNTASYLSDESTPNPFYHTDYVEAVLGHGTGTAGTLGAVGNNGIGVAGVAWDIGIVPVKINYDDIDSYAYYSDMIDGIRWCADQGVKVANLSYGGAQNSGIAEAAQYLRERGGLLFMSAGNDGIYNNITEYPDYTSFVAVGATDGSNSKADFSEYGPFVDIVAPGVYIRTTYLNGSYVDYSGTSFSAPMAAGLAALIYSINPQFTPSEVENIIFNTAVDLGDEGDDDLYGHGRINVFASLEAAVNSPLPQYNVYYGHLHNHSNVSDGTGTPAYAYDYAKNVAGLDFFSLADHAPAISSTEWTSIKAAAEASNEDGVFAAFWGFEWSSSANWGHIAVINTPDYCTSGDSATNTFDELVSWLDTRDGVAFFNHPGREDDLGKEFNHFNSQPSDKFVGIELFNKSVGFSTYYYNDGYDYTDGNKSFYDEALERGWDIGASGSEDNHAGTWGIQTDYRMGVLAEEKTRTAIYNAFKKRRFFSSLDKNIYLSFELNGQQMGSVVNPGTYDCIIKATDDDYENFTEIQLIKNGAFSQNWSFGENITPVITFPLTTLDGDYYYVKVTQADGEEAISSPIFIVNSNHVLTVNKTGSGDGRVTSDPAGIDCGAICSTGFPEDESITLSAGPDPDSEFSGWSGECSAGQVTMDADKTCTATFNKLCGNGDLDDGEECDGSYFAEGIECEGCNGTPSCNADCSVDMSPCYNNVCEAGENCYSCPQDCIGGTSSGAICGNSICEAGNGEDCVSCPADCNGMQTGKPSGRFCCGDGDGRNPKPCSDLLCGGPDACIDISVSGVDYCCGDDECSEGLEDAYICALDCGAPPPPPLCGDGSCDAGEDQCGGCPDDCGTPPNSETGLCSDGIDNDCDGDIDAEDSDDCSSIDCSELKNQETCVSNPTCRWHRKKGCLNR